MRSISFILAFGFVLAGPSMAGSTDSLPGAGTFSYDRAPATSPAMVIAGLTLAKRS